MSKVVPWESLVELVQPHTRGAHQALSGPPPFAVETTLRISFLQLKRNPGDPTMQEAMHARPFYRLFVDLDAPARLPFESTFQRFRHLLGTSARSATINAALAH